MLRAKVIRKKRAKYPAAFRRIDAEFLNTAGRLIEGQAKANAPVRTGRLKNSINSRVSGDVAIVGTAVEYAAHVEYGTKYQKAQPYMRPAIDSNRKKLVKLYEDIVRKVFGGR
jgi:HK97 gp10 family phage protein